MLSWSRTAEEIVTGTQTGGDKKKSKVKQEVVNCSHNIVCARGSTDSKCNGVVKGAVVHNVPLLDGGTSPDQR